MTNISLKISSFSPWVGIRNISDYSPFGVLLAERTVEGAFYRNGFQGMEGDLEVKGEGNSYTTEFRQYDPRIGRWLTLDPLMAQFPHTSPYVAFDNNPIFYTDPYGLSPGGPNGEAPEGYTCTDEAGATRTYTGNGNWEGFDQYINNSKNGLVILFSSENNPSENQTREKSMENDNNNAGNNNFTTIMVDDVRLGFELANEFSDAKGSTPNTVVFRQHGNVGTWYFPIGDNDHVGISKKEYNYFIVDFPDDQSVQAQFYRDLAERKYSINSSSTTLIFTNCRSGKGEDGQWLGRNFSDLLQVGNLFLNMDKSPYYSKSNLDMPLTYKTEEELHGWVVYVMMEVNGFIYFDRVETGKSLQLNSSGTAVTQPDLKQ